MCKDFESKKCCFTGYRPSKFPFELNNNSLEYKNFENNLLEAILTLYKDENCNVFYSGMAMGFDIIASELVLLLNKASNHKIKLVCILPFNEQQAKYDPFWSRRYENVLKECDDIIVTSDKYYGGCYQKRNCYMVDNCDFVLTWFDGKKGGTNNTLRYANSKKRGIININSDYEKNDDGYSQLQLLFDN